MRRSRTLPLAAALLLLTVTGTSGTKVGAQAERKSGPAAAAGRQQLLLVSYAVTKAAYDRIIPLFQADWKRQTGQDVEIRGSYGGSGSQTLAVIDGLPADVVGLATASDIQRLQDKGIVQPGWQRELPYNSVATNSTVAAFVRPGNPRRIRSWSDLARRDVVTVLADPRTSGVARWNLAALWGSVRTTGGSEEQAAAFLRRVVRPEEPLPRDARAATEAFVNRGRGDVLLNWETEGFLLRRNGKWKEPWKLLTPSILTEMPVAVVDRNVDRRGTRRVAEAFARFLFTPEAQKVFVDHGFRPVTAEGLAYARGRFQNVRFFRIGELGGWPTFDRLLLASGGLWDQILGRRG